MANVSAKRQITKPIEQCVIAHINAGDEKHSCKVIKLIFGTKAMSVVNATKLNVRFKYF